MAMITLLPVLLLCCSSLLTATSDYVEPVHVECVSNTNYTRGGAFQANLEALLSSLASAAAASGGFAKNATGGAAPGQQPAAAAAYVLAQCRRDVSPPVCSKCVDKMARKLRGDCPGLSSAIAISGTCMLHYSNASFFGEGDSSFIFFERGAADVPQPELFATRLDALMNNLTRKAAYGSPRLYAVGDTDHTPPMKIYGMAQCTGDLGKDDCYKCLNRGIYYIWNNWNQEKGGQSYLWSCYLRFESALFYNLNAAEAAMSAAAPAPAPGDDGSSSNYSNQSSQGSSKRTARTALLASIPIAVTLLVLLVAGYLCNKRQGNAKQEMASLESIPYDLSTLRAATNNFSEQNRLGQGAFGPVYKGKLQNGEEIAVKRLSKTSQQGQEEMTNEVVLVAKLQHKNLVRLLGYCIDKDERLLVYEFLSNKSLDKILYGPVREMKLSWEQRYKIIYGISRGLMYLHEDSRLTIIHRDLKPGNILLDADMNPKISDFGLAKLFNIDLRVANTDHVAGTRGYMAPEYTLNGIFSTKSDVFSYGVLLLEVVTGRRPYNDLVKFVWGNWRLENMPLLLEGCSADEHGQMEMLRCIHIGLLCVQDDPELRPHMAAVVLMLNSPSMTLAIPTEPVFAATGDRPGAAVAVADLSSINEASLSVMQPR